MAFGQQSGPPATAKQLEQLLGLLQDAGHRDFRDARGPLGFTQRQANGKFTRAEADELIEQLQTEADASSSDAAVGTDAADGAASGEAHTDAAPAAPARRSAPVPRLPAAQRALANVPAAVLAAELQRRGWIVVEP